MRVDKEVVKGLQVGGVPRHVGFIVDGNRRWARERGLPTMEGHRKGLQRVEEVVEACFGAGVEYVSFYVFSTENWGRAEDEVDYLMKMVKKMAMRLARKMLRQNARLVVLGAREGVAEDVLAAMDGAEAVTAGCDGGVVGMCFNYGGRREIVDAVGKIRGEVTEAKIRENLYHAEIPDVDLVVRTSGEERISGFMLWRVAYAEMLFVEKYWPDIGGDDVCAIIGEYQTRNRRFGK
jgi:undecaprenyl diphosphate synthase